VVELNSNSKACFINSISLTKFGSQFPLMTIHKEGYKIIAWAIILFGGINILSFYIFSFPSPAVSWIIFFVTLVLLVLVISFFRIPKRAYTIGDDVIVAPADGKIVTIEEIQADEYFKDRRLQVSIFMSPLNVHVNLNPLGGEVVYSKYHSGKYLVAWHPKSSTDNERHTIVYRNNEKEILVKQIAGALAKRIVNYLQVGQRVEQATEMGFIKFGSRVDLIMPLNVKLKVKIGDWAKGGVTVIATW
jgi:phosphatidylserine decarboxylase